MDEHDNRRTGRAHRRALTWRLGALTLAATGALVGCGGGATTTAPDSSPVAAPSVDDAAVTIVPPTVDPSTSAGAAAPGAGTPSTASSSDPMPQAVTGSSSGQSGTVPGVADKAVALPPSASVADDGRCGIRDLKLAPIDLQGSPGGTYANFRLVNVSASTCAVRGYLNATLIGDNGKDLVTSVRHEDGPEAWVQVEPKGSAQFHLRFPNPFSGSTPCNPPNAAKVRVTLASTSGTMTSATPEGGIQACKGQLSTAPVGST